MEMDDDMSMSSGMSMSFEFTCDVGPMIFSWWTINTCTAFYLSCIPIILLGIARHFAFSCVSGASSSKGGPASRNTALLESSGFESSTGSKK